MTSGLGVGGSSFHPNTISFCHHALATTVLGLFHWLLPRKLWARREAAQYLGWKQQHFPHHMQQGSCSSKQLLQLPAKSVCPKLKVATLRCPLVEQIRAFASRFNGWLCKPGINLNVVKWKLLLYFAYLCFCCIFSLTWQFAYGMGRKVVWYGLLFSQFLAPFDWVIRGRWLSLGCRQSHHPGLGLSTE